MNNIQKIIIIIGVVIVFVGLTWQWISKLPFGKLPGDIIVDKPSFKLFFPITSMIILSILVSLIIWIIKKFF
ncbi:MAG: DUF2905 domain-containing protein [Ignavibacterium sp.]|jgi:uncharacterized membrane protein (DUF106 family)|nr:DUF2905 domain-containing protein [Ignavibacterium sp.]